MSEETLVARPHPTPRTVLLEDGTTLEVPEGWELLPPGDAGLTRRVKAAGPSWTVQEKKGRKKFSKGVWAPAANIATERARIDAERDTPAYRRKMAAAKAKRERDQEAYVEDFREAVVDFLAFHPENTRFAVTLADAVTAHATPVGSGTVARTKRIPVEKRAESAVIAWMRHQTTAYDDMKIERVKGRRREVRGQLAGRSRALLQRYRDGAAGEDPGCPLASALGG